MHSSTNFIFNFLFCCTAGCQGFSPIRSLITYRAFTSSVLNTINEQFVTDNDIVQDVFQSHMHVGADILYTFILGGTVYLQWKFYMNKHTWEDIGLYSSIRRKSNSILLVLFIVFIKNVENAI